jgi:hypothetical protein
MRETILLLFLLASSVGHATTLAPVPIDSLYKEADIVATIQIVEGKVVENNEGVCGALYEGRIINSFKGVSDEETVIFGHYFHYEVGGKYLVFLTKPGTTFRSLASANMGIESERQKALEQCKSVRTGHEIMHSGNGIMRMYDEHLIDSNSVIKVSKKYVPLPEALKVKPAAMLEFERYSDYVWVQYSELSDFLESLSSKAYNKRLQLDAATPRD